jgi:hypothetical protein
MSNLTLGSISGMALNGNIVSVPSGHVIKQPGSAIQTQRIILNGIGAITSTSSFTTVSDSSGSMSIPFIPKVSTSIIKVEWMLHGVHNGSDLVAWIAPFKDSNSLYTGESTGMLSTFNYGNAWKYTYGTYSDGNIVNTHSGHFWDTATNTTSRIYTLKLKTRSGAFYINRSESENSSQAYSTRGVSSFTITEIAQ